MPRQRMFDLAFVFVLGWLASLSGCSSKPDANKPDETKPGTAAAPKSSGPQPTEAKADFPPLSVEDFAKEFNADESAAATKYKNKSVVLTGIVVERDGDPNKSGGIRLILAGEKGDKPVNVRAELGMFDAYTVDQFPKLKAGDTVKVNGTLMYGTVKRKEGKPGEVELNMGSLVK